MKPYTLTVEIQKPRDEVIELFNCNENLFKWQTGLVSVSHVAGEPGQVGAQQLMVYQNGKHRIELTETITKVDLPDEFNGTYEWAGGMNTLVNRFIEVDDQTTHWESTCSYRFQAFMLKLMGVLVPSMFRKQNLTFMKNFKAFCEEGRDVRESGPVK